MINNITKAIKGLFTNSLLQDQPKETYTFALNAVMSTDEGEKRAISNEESNNICALLPEGQVPIGKRYIGQNRIVVLSVNEVEKISEIGIFYADACQYETHVNDADVISTKKLGFSIKHQIDIEYKLRQGCEDTIYWVDGPNNRPMTYNFHKPEQFKDQTGSWNKSKFYLQKTYESIPVFQDIEVLNYGGNIEPGSYNISIEYVDDSLNPTEWITSSSVIRIYNDDLTRDYKEIKGSIKSTESYLDFGNTNKAIRITLDPSSLDKNFLYYRLAFIKSSNNSGQVNGVYYSEVIPTSKNFFIYTGENHVEIGTEEEIKEFTSIIDRASHIVQLDNMLVLADTEGFQTNFCKLQKYASKIKADCIVKEVLLNDIKDGANPKNPSCDFNGGLGYSPMEIYSFGVVYIFEGNVLSPVCHIPGKAITDEGVIFSINPGEEDFVFPMGTDNAGSSVYLDNNTCSSGNFWGLDYNGDTLVNKPVRHHRFPSRKEIGKPLVEIEGTPTHSEQTFYNLELSFTSTFLLPTEEDPHHPDFAIRVHYTVNGINKSFTMPVEVSLFADGVSTEATQTFNYTSNYEISDNIVVTSIEISRLDNGSFEDYNSYVGTNGSDYFVGTPPRMPSTPFSLPILSPDKGVKFSIVDTLQTFESKKYKTNILGIKFSNIEKPSLEDTNGLEVIGYYIVRNERTDFEKTVLGSAVLFPTVKNDKFVSSGLLQPVENDEDGKIGVQEKMAYSLISPEHRFKGININNYDEIIQEGNFKVVDKKYGKVSINDVYDGTSFNSDMKDKNDDGPRGNTNTTSPREPDGFSYDLITRDNILEFESVSNNFTLNKQEDIDESFLLDALESRTLEFSEDPERPFWEVYNISADNKIGIVKLKDEDKGEQVSRFNLPYVILKRKNLDSYGNFRLLPYYKVTTNPSYFRKDIEETAVFGGDTQVHPLRYATSIYWDNVIACRAFKTNAWNWVLAGAFFVASIFISIFTVGAGAVGSAALIGAGSALVAGGGSVLFLSAGIKEQAFIKAYREEWERGLKETALDEWTDDFYNYKAGSDNDRYLKYGMKGGEQRNNGGGGPSDDSIQWMGEALTDLWFETSVNISLRNSFTSGYPTHLDAPGYIENGNISPIEQWEYFRCYWTLSRTRFPISKLEDHLMRKILVSNPDRADGWECLGLPFGEYYNVNPDYERLNKQKVFFHLPLEYDCCSDCQEKFPHRLHYSEQAYQEELSDNYRIFLPNNYVDIEGNTGRITNLYNYNSNLFIHTEEALWQMPRNHQERITDQIVSFIGTGEYFSIPPKKIIDDDTGNSAGSIHKWGSIKTPAGIFFPSENQKKFYQLNEQGLRPIAEVSNSNLIRKISKVQLDENYFNLKRTKYPYIDNPSNEFGTGYVSAYDSRKERILFTKKDFIFDSNIFPDNDFEICSTGGEMIIFDDISQTIKEKEDQGWVYTGIEDCRLKFEKEVIEVKTETRYIMSTVEITSDTIIIPFFDTSSMGPDIINNLSNTLDLWFPAFKASINNGDNNITLVNPGTWNRWATEDWVLTPNKALSNIGEGKEVLLLVFVDETQPLYHGNTLSEPMSAATNKYKDDLQNFLQVDFPKFKNFVAINYPIVRPVALCKEYLQHAIGAIEGRNMTEEEVDALTPNPNFSEAEWNIVKRNLKNHNAYANLGRLKDFGWMYKENRVSGIDNNFSRNCPPDGVSVVTPCQFTEDIEEVLRSSTSVVKEAIEVEVEYTTTIYDYVDGRVLKDFKNLDNSFTVSYSLEEQNLVSFHSYLPYMYMSTPNEIFSLYHRNFNIHKHNVKGHYQNFNGVRKPFILEFVASSDPVATKIWDYIQINTIAKRYKEEFEDFVEDRFITFNKGLFYNSRQNSGILNLIVKNTQFDTEDYLLDQVKNLEGDSIIIDRNEKEWSINQLRDIRSDYTQPMFIKNIEHLQEDYYIDKLVNYNSLDLNKDWSELESFRDKYLVIRLIFDNFDDVKLIFNFSLENEVQSYR